MSTLEVKNISRVYNVRGTGFRSKKLRAVDDVSFKLEQGDRKSVV